MREREMIKPTGRPAPAPFSAPVRARLLYIRNAQVRAYDDRANRKLEIQKECFTEGNNMFEIYVREISNTEIGKCVLKHWKLFYRRSLRPRQMHR